MRNGIMMAAAALAIGCAPAAEPAAIEPGAGSPPELGASFNVHIEADTARLELHITNVTDRTLRLEFGSTQRYDFAVDEPDGDGVFRWSADHSFAQMIGHEELAPGESRRYTASWPVTTGRGEYVATAWLTSSDHPVELRTRFEVPEQ